MIGMAETFSFAPRSVCNVVKAVIAARRSSLLSAVKGGGSGGGGDRLQRCG